MMADGGGGVGGHVAYLPGKASRDRSNLCSRLYLSLCLTFSVYCSVCVSLYFIQVAAAWGEKMEHTSPRATDR